MTRPLMISEKGQARGNCRLCNGMLVQLEGEEVRHSENGTTPIIVQCSCCQEISGISRNKVADIKAEQKREREQNW